MINHELLPTAETWSTGEAQRYGWRYHSNSEGVYGAYGHMFIAHRAIPTARTQEKVNMMREQIEREGWVNSRFGDGVMAADVVVANAMKPDGQVSADHEAFDLDVGLNVGVYILVPSVELSYVPTEQ